ncbi:TonB-linked outer membrane protein, SusC/RagA family [Fodinibius roseus]|uniref:TonB-linked outer membrane protein, SusC/RagA family n=1 Tax=Fodinibius roseus TaxID=1194090 RepID=A0A1M4SZU1_9BACT|nr:TonB-dependent receptor [Fodinibius roseus]SHE37719.1 TonB-linked outer membrane protein, SusC/RagA family [Fodinibius roseus]
MEQKLQYGTGIKNNTIVRHRINRLLVTVLVTLICGTAYGQTAEVAGTVTDSNSGEVLPGVNISVAGTTIGTTTNAEGRFRLEVPSLNDTLRFSFIGYESQSLPINGRTTIDVQLVPSVISGSEVVVVGYGEQQRSSLTGSISSVSAEELNEVPVGNIQQSLQGRVAGMTVRNNGGPGEDPIVQIRGISSINYASDPLFVVDGLPTDISNVNSNDIASIEVLKDASAAAIYGSRATNGVVLVTTKKGSRDSRLAVSYDSYAGIESPWKEIDLLNTDQYLEYERALNGAAGISRPPRLEPDNFNEPIYEGASQTYAETNTDWQDAYFKNGLLTNHQLSLSGGNDISSFYLSGGYFKQEGIAVGLNHQRGNFKLNSQHYLSDVVTVGENFSLSYSKQRFDDTEGNRTRLFHLIRSLPYLPVRDPTTMGGFREAENSIDGADPESPVKNARLLGQSYNDVTELLGTIYLDMDIAPWLNFRSTFGVNYSNGFIDEFDPIYDSKGNSSNTAIINNERNVNTTLLFTQQLTYNQTFLDKHHLNVVAVYEQEERDNFNEISSGNHSTNSLRTLAGATNVAHETIESESRLLSFIGRLSYEYDDKYLLNLAMRRDGLSIWAPGNKWANFPSGSVGWRVDQEGFMKDQSLISELKIRGGYGVTGLNASLIGDNYPWQVSLQANAATYPFNNENDVGNASYFRELGNIDLEWEKTEQWNIGVDLGLLSNRITFTADYYQRYTDNLLLEVPIPTSFGLNEGGQGNGAGVGVLANVGEMENNGLDVQLGYHNVEGEFNWDITGLVSVVRNEVLSLDTPTAVIGAGGDVDFGGGEDLTRTEAGHPIQSFYGYVVDGIFQNQQEVENAPTQSDAAPGDLKFRDLNDDGVINADDRRYIGSYIPDFSYSLNFNAYYKSFDLSLFFQGVQGNEIFDGAGIVRQGMARLFGAGTAVLDAWTPENRNTDIPRAISGDPNGNKRPSTRWIEDGSYLRLKNIQLGYNMPVSTLDAVSGGTIRNLRLYVAAYNLFTFTGYPGWDPEIGSQNNTLTNGIDYGQYPAARSFRIGLQVDL